MLSAAADTDFKFKIILVKIVNKNVDIKSSADDAFVE
jgi:hypothetical protein